MNDTEKLRKALESLQQLEGVPITFSFHNAIAMTVECLKQEIRDRYVAEVAP